MKKIVMSLFAVLLVAVTAVQAQKVNKNAFLAKIEKSDADIANPKKSGKASTWLNRGKLFYETALEPTKNLFVNMGGADMLRIAVGEPESVEQTTLLEVPVEAWVYPYFTVYIKDGQVATWKQTQWIREDAIVRAIEAYNKAYELDPEKMAQKVKEGLQQVSDLCSQMGNVGLDSGDYAASSDAYALAYEAQSSPAFGGADPSLLYYAGYLRTVDGTANPASFAMGADYLNKALAEGFVDEKGDIYYYLFHCYYGQRDKGKEYLEKGSEALQEGIRKFPRNERILDGLIQLYTSGEGVGNPADLTSLVDKAVEEMPDNVSLWFGRGRVYFALADYDEAIASLEKVNELEPGVFENNYYLGLFYTVKADALNDEVNSKQFSSVEAFNEAQKEVGAVYMQAIPWLEKAHEIKPEDENTVNYLKQLCFRMRDEEGIMDKYNTYNALLKKMRGEE